MKTKPLINENKIQLKRALGLTTAVLMVAGNMIGAGVFKKIVPIAASGLSGNYILGAWIFAGFIALFGAFNIAGLAKLTTESGGEYEYLNICFGDLVSFLFGWGYFSILGSGSIAAVSFIFSQSINSFIHLPDLFNKWKDISVAHYI